ncbi:uncharacterized protein K460DRAFT_374193 [Cucurbitaria berberidis CBS 394.84]|uniref:Microbial-type PARG catalytic domain-containing protein n=1 Tax=Cucurbitaria berberidis CBS 394.84 TaxID=1168544 RepID=A0A9P4GK10_9PLEO|nr:uncharacterized protein K460DRAFT_374193 [Cucurbitaria berberidis CBS 394.84]KAF1847037.1 hypothetical protein K460DRAFT_374193 [Cucurbitaria berberidis CBS 394.84]
MGRTEKSQGLAPPAIRKDMRAKQARHIVNKVVPATLASNARARRGAEDSELIVDPGPAVAFVKGEVKDEVDGGEDAGYVKRRGQGRRKAKGGGGEEVFDFRDGNTSRGKGRRKSMRKTDSLDEALSNLSVTSAPPPPSPDRDRRIRIISTDTLTAAHMLTFSSQYSNTEANPSKKAPNVCILNMASPLRPVLHGGVLTGATSQEETLCTRTTLLPSLKESFYRLPELGGIWTSDVLVLGSHLPLDNSKGELGPSEKYWIDVISAGMLRFPDLEDDGAGAKRLGRKDAEMVEAKMRAVLRIAASKGAKKLVLGAWGCGAYANPVPDVARAWRKVLDGATNPTSSKGKGTLGRETWPEVEAVIFAISNRKMAVDFAQAFGNDIEVEAGPGNTTEEEDEEVEEEDKEAEELRTRIQEMEGQLSKVWNPDLRSRMGVILETLKAQLRERGGATGNEDEIMGRTALPTNEDARSSAYDEQGMTAISSQADVGSDDDEEEDDGGEGKDLNG